MSDWKWRRAWLLCLPVVLLAMAYGADQRWPLPSGKPFAQLVVARDGTPLRAFADDQGIWRYPIALDGVSPNYVEALLGYEDRWFHWHPGVNPIALLRAAWQWQQQGRVVSGGSTLTMQVARLLEPHPRTVAGKARQMARALQLEWYYSKADILQMYINMAPFGGTIEGIQAAAYTYLGKSARELSDAEAALLAVMPQAPSYLRPDRHPHRAQVARDKLLLRLQQHRLWSPQRVSSARQEMVWPEHYRQPRRAPLLARHLRQQYPQQSLINSTLDSQWQATTQQLLQNWVEPLPAGTSAAAIIVDNRTMAALAYVGSANFDDPLRFGHVDMVRAQRSPGSTLKPFIYGQAIEQGLVHSQSLLTDAPLAFGSYQPRNFSAGFRGPVSVTEALQRSLNVPAIQVLEQLGSQNFYDRLRQAGIKLQLPTHARPNLSIGLGGAALDLLSLVGAFRALAVDGIAARVRLHEDQTLQQRRLLQPGAAWIVREMLSSNRQLNRLSGVGVRPNLRPIAWKTGTSYGYRDSWSVGVSPRYTVGVWVGRPDGSPLPGHYGAATAAPLLFRLMDQLPELGNWPAPPRTVTEVETCWPLGLASKQTAPAHCHQRHTGWVYQQQVPPTLPHRSDWLSNPVWLREDRQTGLRVDRHCHSKAYRRRAVALWPAAVDAYLPTKWQRRQLLPPWHRDCLPATHTRSKALVDISGGGLRIEHFRSGAVFQATPGLDHVMLNLQASGGSGLLHWSIDGHLLHPVAADKAIKYRIDRTGRLRIAVIDQSGHSDEVIIEVRI